MSHKEPPKVVYLDQKCWIELAKIQFGSPSDQEKALLNNIKTAVSENRAIFPLTLSNMEESYRIRNDEQRAKLASVMIEVSQGYSFQPYLERNLRAEIVNIIRRKVRAPTIDIRSKILKQGISNMVGAKATLVPKKGAKPLPDEIMRNLLEMTENPETIEILLREGAPRKFATLRKSDINAMERIRRNLWKVKDKNLRYRVYLVQNISALVIPEIGKLTIKYNLPHDLIISQGLTRKDMDALIEAMPTALCLFTLIYHRDQQLSRPIQGSDFNDIWFLTLAIPYSDIVVTERMWASIAIRSKLDRKCNTRISHSIQELDTLL